MKKLVLKKLKNYNFTTATVTTKLTKSTIIPFL